MKRKTPFITSYFYALLSTIYVFLIGWTKKRNRSLMYQISEHFGLKPHKDYPELPLMSQKDVVGDLEKITLHEPIAVNGNVSTSELLIISSLVKKFQCKNIFEIGTFDGRTTLNMAANAPEDAQIFTLDLPQEEMSSAKLEITNGDQPYIQKAASGLRFSGTPYSKRIKQLYGDSATFDFTAHSGKVDCIFVDGSHSYSYVVSDTKNALKVCPDGLIIWHDYNLSCKGVIQALNEFQASEPRFKDIVHIEGTSLVVCFPKKQSFSQKEFAS